MYGNILNAQTAPKVTFVMLFYVGSSFMLHLDLLHINQDNCDKLAHPWFIPLF